MAGFNGTSGDDRIIGTEDADTINGGAGKDRINGGDGDDVAHGGDGNDYVYGDGGNDKLYGGAGNDALIGHSGEDEIFGGDGNDGVFGGGNDDTIMGEAGTDTLFGDGGNDTIDGGADSDRLFGGSGNDTLVYKMGEGADELVGNTGSDTIRLVMTSQELAANRGEIVDFYNWLQDEISNAGGEGAHAGQNTGNVFTFASNGLKVSAVETVELVVDGQNVPVEDLLNQAPELDATQNVATAEDTPFSGQVLARDPDGDTMVCSVAEGPQHGQVSLNEQTGEFTYTPDDGHSGTDNFTIEVTDPDGATAQQVVSVDVAPVADAPTLEVANPTGATLDGSDGSDTIVGSAGDDVIDGGAGDDVINGDPTGGRYVVDLDISAELNDTDGSEQLSITISGVPDDAGLSAGTSNGNGEWSLTAQDLDGLQLKYNGGEELNLTVSATATESNGDTNTVSQQVTIDDPSAGGDDVISGGAGNDRIDGGEGTDTVDYSDAPGGVYVNLDAGIGLGEGVDRITNVENVTGGDAGDLIIGDQGANVIESGAGGDAVFAGGGDDTIVAGAGNDIYHGGSGEDTVDFSNSDAGVSVNLHSGRSIGAETGNDRIHDIENVEGSQGDDTITGSRSDNVLSGGAGDDAIRGGRGADTLTGGEGADTFAFNKTDVISGRNHHGVDTITDFGGGDRLDFSKLLRGVRYDDLSDVVRLSQSEGGTMVSVELNGSPGLTDVVFLEGVFDLDLDFLDGSDNLIV